MLLEMRRLQMRGEMLQVGGRKQTEKIVHNVLPCDRRERRELSAIGAYARYPIMSAGYVNYRT